MVSGKNYIGGKLVGSGNVVFHTFNPIKNEPTPWEFVEVTDGELDEACELAKLAFEEYRGVSGEKRALFLDTIAEEIEVLGDDLLNVYMQESGLRKDRALAERKRTVEQLRKFAGLLRNGSWVDARINTPNSTGLGVDLRKMNQPIGPIVVFGASNFPLAYSTAGGDTASALAAGCPVIVKSHPMHAGTGELVASAVVRAIHKTGMPVGVFANLNSSGIQVGKRLLLNPHVKGVGFTGSINGGRALMDLAAKRDEPIPVFAEMGSINPVVLLPDYLSKNRSEIVQMYANSITQDAGQFCTNPGLIIGIKSDELKEFAKELGAEVVSKDPFCMVHPQIHSNFEKGKEVAIAENVHVVAEYVGDKHQNCGAALVVSVSGSQFENNPKLHNEVFGPFSMIVECEDLHQMKRIIDQLEGQLTGSILATEDELKQNTVLVDKLKNRVGRLIWNGVPTGVEVCPAMMHGGPYPASSDTRFTAVGVDAIKRWVRPIAFQNWPDSMLPDELKNGNPCGIMRMVDGVYEV